MDWREEPHRWVLYCGEVAVGAVFKSSARGHYWRWRAWVTTRCNPFDGVKRTEQAARDAVQGQFEQFLDSAHLIRKAVPERSGELNTDMIAVSLHADVLGYDVSKRIPTTITEAAE